MGMEQAKKKEQEHIGGNGMNCNECPMRYVCEAILGGKEKCVYKETDDGTGQVDTERT